MRMSELSKRTGVNRESIRYYIREGLLPKPRKISRNIAEYTEKYVDQVLLIRELQDRLFLPLAAIKKIMRKGRISDIDKTLVRLQSDYLQPLDHLLPGQVKGESKFLEATGINVDRLADFEAWGIITPKRVQGEKVYSQEDLTIGKIISGFRRLGLGVEHGSSPHNIKEMTDLLKDILNRNSANFNNIVRDLPLDKQWEMANSATEIAAQLLYHLYKKLSQDLIEQMRARME
jgi:DNA-binding transcriptional MerR regulator